MSRIRTLTLIGFAGTLFAATAAPAQLRTDRVTNGFTKPTFITALPGDTSRLFVLEQAGYVRIIKNGDLLARPFLNIIADVNDADNEQGLLGLAFDADYATNGFFYVYFTGGTGAGNSQIRRYTVSSDPDSASAATSFRILQVAQPAGQGNHKGGQIAFGNDGYLYLGLGDGGGANDQGNRAQNGTTLLGKMLRIDVDGDDFPADANNNYAIPSDNPFVGVQTPVDFLDAIWSYGLRNPYRWSFDRLTYDMYIGDVGQGEWEEIDFEPSSDPGGRNYGWRLMEGPDCFNPPVNCDDGDPVLTYPIHAYEHNPPEGGFFCSVTGGYVYRGTKLPAAVSGHYFFADYCADRIWSFKVVGGVLTEFTNWTSQLTPSIDGFIVNDIVAIGEDADGEIYIVDRAASAVGQGEVFKVIPNDGTAVDDLSQLPKGAALELGRAIPNPFMTQASFDVRVAQSANVTIGVYDASGRFVQPIHEGLLSAGRHTFTWDGSRGASERAAAGVYFVRAEGLGVSTTQRVALLR